MDDAFGPAIRALMGRVEDLQRLTNGLCQQAGLPSPYPAVMPGHVAILPPPTPEPVAVAPEPPAPKTKTTPAAPKPTVHPSQTASAVSPDKFAERYNAGVSYTKLAKEFNRSEGWVSWMVKRHNLPRRPMPKQLKGGESYRALKEKIAPKPQASAPAPAPAVKASTGPDLRIERMSLAGAIKWMNENGQNVRRSIEPDKFVVNGVDGYSRNLLEREVNGVRAIGGLGPILIVA